MGGDIDRIVRESALRALRRTVEGGAGCFDRGRMLPRLLPVGPETVADTSAAGRLRVLRLLARALRGERRRGRAGHWSYSLDRHLGLAQAWRAERAALAALGIAPIANRAETGRAVTGAGADRGTDADTTPPS